jgi:hypothetical protein
MIEEEKQDMFIAWALEHEKWVVLGILAFGF